jgi:hypothetical protein
MYKIFSLIAFFGLPLGERFANVLIKILRVLGFVRFFGIPFHGEKLEELGDKLVNLDDEIDKKLSGEKWDKIFGFIGKLFILGPIYIGWLIMKWTCKLSWKLVRFIFRRKRRA